MGFTEQSGKFLNISMGQGQEAPAEASLQRYAQSGGWIMLQVCIRGAVTFPAVDVAGVPRPV
jgi:hypothetical protein